MKGSSSSSSSARPYTGKWEHDVFVCFRGADTRRGFTSHLAGALREKGLRTFIDNFLERTEPIDELLTVLKKSAMSVVVFSEKFAESRWCLDEVATIVESMDKFGHKVLPIFYRIDPDDVSDDHGSYAATIDAVHKPTPEVKKRWRDALKVVAKHAGRTSNEIKDEDELCITIQEDVLKKLSGMSSRGKFNNRLVGMETRVAKVQQLLAMDDGTSSGIRVIGLWGMGGVGKTTLANTCYQLLITSSTSIDKHHFVSNVSNNCKTPRELEEVVLGLYSNLLSEKNLRLQDLDVDFKRERLLHLKVVVVLDNVETIEQLEELLLGEILDPTKLFGPGSIIIITSRDRAVPCHVMAKTYNVEELDSSESLDLFSMHAFKQRCPFEDLMDLSQRAVSYCKGNPLAIKVLGGALFRKDKKYWESSISGLADISQPKIHDILSTSYHALKVEERRLFLDVACFFGTTAKTYLIGYLATSYAAAYSLVQDLTDKSLLVCVSVAKYGFHNEEIQVHDLLREMAWNIVNAEPTPRFLKMRDGIHNNNFAFPAPGDKAVEGVDLDLYVAKEMHLRAKAFEGMDSLRLLRFHYPGGKLGRPKFHLPNDGLDILPNELRWLKWEAYPSKFLPKKFIAEKLTVLDLRHSRIIRCWKEDQPKLVHLIKLDLSHCINLSTVPNLSGCQNLEILRVKGCTSLVELLSSHVQDLDKLVELDLSDCSNLEVLPARLNSKCLEDVDLSNCPKVTFCPEINNSQGLKKLDLEGTPVSKEPSAIHKVKQVGMLHLSGKHITTFPRISTSLARVRLCDTSIRDMVIPSDSYSSANEFWQRVYGQSFDGDSPLENVLNKHWEEIQQDLRADHLIYYQTFFVLELVGNSQLTSLSDNIWEVVKGQLSIEDSPLIESLPDISIPVNWLTAVCIKNCGNLRSFPSGINNLKSLEKLYYQGTAIQSLPASILLLDKLRTLDLSDCGSLESLPNLSGCPNLVSLLLSGCRSLVELPSDVQDLEKLAELDLSDCLNLQVLPARLNSKCLEYVTLTNCPKVTLCPEINNSERGLKKLDLEGTPVREMPSAIHKVRQGGSIRLCGKHITTFPRISTSLDNLCVCHTAIKDMFVPGDSSSSSSDGCLPSIDTLWLVGNSQLTSLSNNIWDVVKHKLWMEGCPLIESLPDVPEPVHYLTTITIKE